MLGKLPLPGSSAASRKLSAQADVCKCSESKDRRCISYCAVPLWGRGYQGVEGWVTHISQISMPGLEEWVKLP